jgi:hypothetical protein
MMEKYGAEIEKYEVHEVIPFQPDDKRIVAKNLTMDEAMELEGKNQNYMIIPMR